MDSTLTEPAFSSSSFSTPPTYRRRLEPPDYPVRQWLKQNLHYLLLLLVPKLKRQDTASLFLPLIHFNSFPIQGRRRKTIMKSSSLSAIAALLFSTSVSALPTLQSRWSSPLFWASQAGNTFGRRGQSWDVCDLSQASMPQGW